LLTAPARRGAALLRAYCAGDTDARYPKAICRATETLYHQIVTRLGRLICFWIKASLIVDRLRSRRRFQKPDIKVTRAPIDRAGHEATGYDDEGSSIKRRTAYMSNHDDKKPPGEPIR
jgi:hypothetical protein